MGVATHASAGAPEPDSSEPTTESAKITTIELVVDTTDLDEEFRGQSEHAIDELLPPHLEGTGYELSEGENGDIVLLIRFTTLEGGYQYHGLHFEFVRDGQAEAAIDWVHCAGCSQVRLAESLEKIMPSLLAALDEERQALAASTAVEAAGDGDGDTSGPDERPQIKAIGPLGGAGVGVAAVGLGVTIAGAVQWSRGQVPEDDLTSETSRGRDFTRQGQLLVGVGAGALVVGAVMLGVDLGLRAKKRSRAGQAQVIPVLGPEQAGIVFQGRF
jgi:hypothetical protein